ncbi:cytochrome aa3 quinol oxidase subunit IV [Paenactinomyces guangxiensis]|uniref:Quinol oxidase subunit 4 n=1 Tax=Paenactinomyces guangxiensis TaxID=1490290 RepID=A0A7W1WNQ4_9BACL|nr:cytochrome aa3 quinol oxidase subunit IV [Paenactinomyces guangxiensis]MBA4493181.1 cytochrome aa3 quinol oxidase subunit IV [Paenactinomyces guangxiensis]MBH8589969.1 cytochrome aa3 quinol oxidase subunit IV [Paenactinomyces guangxiensis]
MDNHKQSPSPAHNHFPWKHLIGFVLSIVLTLMALWVAFQSGLSLKSILVMIVILAIFQAVLQLLMFMHLTEGNSGKIQTGTMLYAAFIAITIVAGSIWVMSSGHAAHDGKQKTHEMHSESPARLENHQ